MKTVEAEIVKEGEPKPDNSQALAVRGETSVGQAMSIDELRTNLQFIRDVMKNVMKDGQDYGKVPGCGDKPSLLQPGAQKLCMLFQLTDEVKEEKVVDFPEYHREYSFVVRLTSKTGRTWEGVGTCSTLESKYRYRKAERRCPQCGRNAIIQGKAEYGGGWVCYKKKQGCGVKFVENDPRIISQPGGTVENENPADYWNTVRKMAFKRALVHASINATNTSELWSQDLEDLPKGGDAPEMPQDEPETAPTKTPAPAKNASPTPKSATGTTTAAPKAPIPFPTEESLSKMISLLNAKEGQPARRIVTEFFEKAGVIFASETLEDIALRFVPATAGQMRALGTAIAAFEAGEPAKLPYEIHPEPTEPKGKKEKAIEVPRDPPEPPPKHPEDWFFDFVVPIPPKGMKRDAYLKNPDTIGSLYELRHGDDDEAQGARQRLWGFVTHFEPKGWTKRDGTEIPPSETDKQFRVALDAFADWFEKNHPDEKL